MGGVCQGNITKQQRNLASYAAVPGVEFKISPPRHQEQLRRKLQGTLASLQATQVNSSQPALGFLWPKKGSGRGPGETGDPVLSP